MGKKYIKIEAGQIPEGIRFDVPGRAGGQVVEIAYGTFGRGEASRGDPYKRITDRSRPHAEPEYYRLVPWGEVTARVKAFAGQPAGTYRFSVEGDEIRIWDAVARHFTLCHSLSDSARQHITTLVMDK